jgi:aromatic-L-amino-acid/L-tryptophan decarboxylase
LEELLNHLQILEEKSSELEPSEELRATWHKDLQEQVGQFLGNIYQTHGYSGKPLEGDFSISGEPAEFREALDIYMTQVLTVGIQPASSAHLGYIPGGGLYASAIADYLASVSNEYAGIYYGSPGAVTIEEEVLNWLKQVFGFPTETAGNLTSGGSIANLIALTSARDAKKIKGSRIERSVIYMSAHTHHCVHKALRIIGLEDVIVRELTLDTLHRIDLAQIENDLKHGLEPTIIIGAAGTTDTGAIDPLNALADICDKYKMWFHIDAAYGGFFILVDHLKDKFKGIERADSLVVDPHKGMFLPYGVGAVLVRDKQAVLHSHHYTANYMQDTLNPDVPLSPAELSPELTKHFRGLRVWLPLRIHGIAPFKACLEEKILLTHYFRRELKNRGFVLGPEPDLSVSYFWCPSEGTDQNDFNKKLMAEIHKDGDVFLSSTQINGKFVIRIAILAFRTKKHTVDRALKMIDRCLEKIS